MLETEIKKLNTSIEELTAVIKGGGGWGGAAGSTQVMVRAEVSVDDHKGMWAKYLTSEKQKEGRERLVDSIRPILSHFGVSRITECSDEQRWDSAQFCQALLDAHGKGGLEAAEAAVKKLPLENQADTGESVL